MRGKHFEAGFAFVFTAQRGELNDFAVFVSLCFYSSAAADRNS